MRGKPQAFSADENRTLRAELRRARDEKGLSQAAVGRLLNVTQQHAGALLGTRSVGMGRNAANALARALSFRDAEELLIERGVLASMQELPSGVGWANRDSAVRIAARIDINQAAVEAVIARYTADEYRSRPIKWWIGHFWEEEKELRAEAFVIVAVESEPAPKKPKRKVI